MPNEAGAKVEELMEGWKAKHFPLPQTLRHHCGIPGPEWGEGLAVYPAAQDICAFGGAGDFHVVPGASGIEDADLTAGR